MLLDYRHLEEARTALNTAHVRLTQFAEIVRVACEQSYILDVEKKPGAKHEIEVIEKLLNDAVYYFKVTRTE